MKPPGWTDSILSLALWGALAACASSSAPKKKHAIAARPVRDPLAGLMGGRGSLRPNDTAQHPSRCVARTNTRMRCPRPPGPKKRNIAIRIALDRRYTTEYVNWRSRLRDTLACVNRLYQDTALQWSIFGVRIWDPGEHRHNLFALLARLRRDYGADDRSLLLGITVWDQQKTLAKGSGEIGLSQAGACVVPSWPRVENDCLILAHELGHLTGAKHVPGDPAPGKKWIMSWAAPPFHLPVEDALARVIATYRFHPRNIAAIDAYYSAQFGPHGLAPTSACQVHINALDRCWFR